MPRRTQREPSQESDVEVSDDASHASEDVFDEEHIPAIDCYAVLGLEKTASENEIKSAYRKAALKWHPDKVSSDQKEQATHKFQEIALAYAVLSEPSRRAFYDRTGSTSESLHHSAGGDDFDWMDFYRSQFHEVVSTDAIDKFAATYKNSQEEKDDILQAYEEGKGDMDHIYESIMLSDVAVDDERIRGIIDEAIKAGDVKAHTKYTKETSASKKRRLKNAMSEANEAMEMAEELGVKDKLFGGKNGETKKRGKGENGGDDDALKALIMGKQQERQQQGGEFLSRLEGKYGGGNKLATKSKAKGKKKKSAVYEEDEEEVSTVPSPFTSPLLTVLWNNDEPSEEAFQAAAAKLKKRKDSATKDEGEKAASSGRSKRTKK